MKILVKKVSETVEDTLNKENVLATIEFEAEQGDIRDTGIVQGRFLFDKLEDMQIYLDSGNLPLDDEIRALLKDELIKLHSA